ncbi:helix-turn-helix domain-containing protein [Streptomyces sp. NPDC001108]
MTDTNKILVDVLDGADVRYKDGEYYQSSKAILYTYDLTPQAMKLWLIIEDHAQQNRKANPGRKRLAELMNVTPNSITNYVRELKEQGWLIVEGNETDGDTNDYILTIPAAYKALDPKYIHTQQEVTIKPKEKLAAKPRTAIENVRDSDRAPRYAISYNHTRDYVPTPLDVRKAAELSQRAHNEAKEGKALTSGYKNTRKALPPAKSTENEWERLARLEAEEYGR